MRMRAAKEGDDTRPPPEVCMITVARGMVGSGPPVLVPAVSSRLALPDDVLDDVLAYVLSPNVPSVMPPSLPEDPLSPSVGTALGSGQPTSGSSRATSGKCLVIVIATTHEEPCRSAV